MTSNETCPFCAPEPERTIVTNSSACAILDKFPVARGHTLIVPKRHIASIFEADAQEHAELMTTLGQAKKVLDERFSPAAFNIGINDGPAAGQTVPHLHIHLIPRYAGDMSDPRGGVRWIFPEKAKYW